MGKSNYLKKLEELKAIAYGASGEDDFSKENKKESKSSSLSVLERIKAQANKEYTSPPKVNTFTFSESGKTGWQKYLDDQQAQKDAILKKEEEKSWWEKFSDIILEANGMAASDNLVANQVVNQYNAMVDYYRKDVSHMRPNDDWSDEQRDAFGTLYLESPTKAYAYAEETNKKNNKAKEEAAIKKIQDSATDNVLAGAGHTVGAIAAAPFGLADFLDDLAKTTAGRDITDDGSVSPFEYSQAVTGGISGHLNEVGGTLDEDILIIGGKGWGDVYGLGTSIAQSAASAYTLGGAGTLISYFGQGAAAGVDDALKRGASNEQAVLYGTALGTFEGVAEMIGIDNLFKIGASATAKEAFKNVLKQAGAEGFEEMFTSIASEASDRIIMGDKSNFNLRVNELMSQGMSEDEAKKKAWLEVAGDVAFDTIGGFVSGGVHAGVHTGIQTTVNNAQNKKYFGDQALDMVNEAVASEDANVKAVGEKYQQKLEGGKNLSGWDITELLETTDAAKVKSAVEAQLTNLGESGDISQLAEVITKQTQGIELSKEEQAIIESSKYGQRILNTLDRDNIKSGEYASGWAESIGTRRFNADVYNKTLYDFAEKVSGLREETEKASVVKSEADITSEAGAKFEASESGKTIYKDAKGGARDATVKRIASTEGELKVELESGETVKASDISFGTKEEALMYEMVARMEVTPETANEIISTFKPSDIGQATKLFSTVPLAYQYGKMGYEAGLKNVALPDNLKKIVYNRGRMDAMVQDKSKTKTATKKGGTGVATKKGGIFFENGFTYDESKANDLQKASMVGIETINKMSNLEVHVFESKVVDGKRVAYVNGKLTSAPNGYYTDGNKIYIDINAGNGGEGAMLYTMGHEVAHYIREWNAKGFRELGDFLIKEYGKKGVPVNALLEAQKDKIKERCKRNNEALPSEAKLADMAYEELVADAMSDMFADEKAYEKLAKLKQKNRNLWQKLGEAIKAILDKLKTALGVYKEKNVDVAQEAYFVREFSQDVYDKLQDLYLKAFVEADANYGAAISEVVEANAKPISNDEIITDGAVVTDGNGTKYSIRSMKHDISEGQMFRDLMEYCGYTKAQVGELRRQLEDLVEYMTPFRDIVDLNETYGREGRRYAPYKPNSDPLYTISLDFSTQCSKRLLTQYVIEQLQLRENRPMSPEEQMAIRDMLKEYAKVEKGLQVACVMCYVEAARLKAPKQIQKWLDDPATAMRNFFADKNPEFSAYIKEAQADFKEARGYDRDATKKDMSAKDRTALNKIRPKLRAEYKPSAEEMKIIETASSLPNSTYLTAGNLADLSETHPEIYKAYTAFIRTATRSKALETDEPYYYGDSRRDNGNGIIVSDSFIEAVNRENGMRFSSWSDWRIQHLLDWITAVIDNSVRGAAMHGYTKYGDEVRVLGKTGMMFNLSGVAGTQTGLNEDGSLNFSDTESIDINEAIELREEFPETAGLQCIGVSKEHIIALLKSDIIDYVIPYHTSGLNATLRRMGNIYGWDDFTLTQHADEDKSIKRENAIDPDNWHKEPVFSEFFVGYETGLGGVEAMRKSAENYKRMCKERGLKPKFLEFANESNYWKLLIDRKMVNQKTNTLIKQKAVTPNFDFGVIKGIVDKYVANYDSGLEQRAFDHIVENWDNIPKRIRDLKKQGTTKANTTKKAIDKLANEPVAVQPKGESKFSDRDTTTQASDFVQHIRDTYKSKGTWYRSDVHKYVESHPELNFIERIYDKDKTAKSDLTKFLSTIDNVKLLNDFRFFMFHAYKDLDSQYYSYSGATYRGATRTFTNAVDKRINEIESARIGGTNLGIKNHEATIDEIETLFYELNSNEEIGKLAERVFATVKRLGVNVRFVNQTLVNDSNIAGDALGDMVEYKTNYFNDGAYTNQQKASTILHELIHACTVYAMDSQSRANLHIDSSARGAVERLERIYREIKNDPDFKGQYGITDAMEMVAELSDEKFVSLLKKKNLWESILDWIANFFGFSKGTSAYDNAMMCLDYLLDNPDVSAYQDYAYIQRTLSKREGKDTFGKTVYQNGRVLYSDRDSSYMDAVNRGDMATAQRMVDEAAEEAGYTDKAYHGTPQFGFTKFDAKMSDDMLSLFFTDNISVASTYAGRDVYKPKRLSSAKSFKYEKGKIYTEQELMEAHNFVQSLYHVYGITKVNVEKQTLTHAGTRYTAKQLLDMADGLSKRGIYEVYLNTNDLLEIDGMWNGWAGLHYPDGSGGRVTTRDIAKYAKEHGYKGVKVTNVYDWGGLNPPVTARMERNGEGDATIFIVFDSNQIKSADPVTYDDNGNVIPLSERFNPGNSDIRYQERDSTSVSNRTLLAGALESVAKEGEERNLLRNYQTNVRMLEAEQKKLSQIRMKANEIRFTKGRTAEETKQMRELDAEAKQIETRINSYDRELLKFEAMQPIKNVLEREKETLRKNLEAKGRKALSEQRQKNAEAVKGIVSHYQESRKKAVEGRSKTAMRHKIQGVVKELNDYLLKGTKDKHVPIGLQKAVAEALDAVNMDTVGAEERIAKKRAEMMKAKSPEVIERLAKEIETIQEMGGNMAKKISRLKTAYDRIIDSDDPLVANSHDDVISNTIERVMEYVGETPLRDMSLTQLEAVYDMYRMVLHSIRAANKAFKAKKSEEISEIAGRVMAEVGKLGKKNALQTKVGQAVSSFDWNNQKPVYAFERIGSDTFTEVFGNVRAGEDTWATDMTEAQAFREDQYKKHNHDAWDFEKKFKFTSASGMDFELTLEQIMSLYAYSKRDQAAEHLKRGGIVFDETTKVTVKNKLGIPVEFNPTEATAYNISEMTLAEIVSKLTAEQKAFVDEMQDYLSTTMGEKGNEVSLELYGIKLFKEKNYFPLKSATQFMAKAKEQQKGEVKIKNSGFTKETVRNANNPIVLTPFMDVWASHVNEMSMYHAFTLALEDFYRVYNYKTPTSEVAATESVEMILQNTHGKAATKYIDQLLRDLNGGARVDSTAGIINKLTGLFKKSAVFASASVVIQQPASIARATALVDTKHFIGKPSKHKETWAEVKKYAPVAVIKEMGYFDTGMGKSSAEWLKGEKTWKDKIDDFASKAPALADEYAWCAIWNAVKRETLHNNPSLKPTSDEFLKLVGERFTEVVTKTQVYDSVLARSANMRSKDTGMKMATAFMGEPTTSLNMLQDALIQGKRGNKRYAKKAIGGVISAMILNAILVSFVYAGRDDDEEKTYAEKYVGTLTEELLDSFNPLTLIPFVKDIVSIAQGYDIERSDMAVVTDLINAWNNLDSDNRSVYRKIEDFGGAIAAIFGLPAKNVMRDVRGMYNTVNSFINGEKTTGSGIGVAITEAITGKEKPNGQQLYEAMVKGDSAQIKRVEGRFEDQSAINSAIRKALRENDPRIHEAAQARYEGNITEYTRIVRAITSEGHFKQDDVVAAINAELNAIKKGETPEKEETEAKDEATSIYSASDINTAFDNGDSKMALEIINDLIETKVANGKTEKEAKSSLRSSLTSYWKPLYKQAYSTGDATEMLRIRKILLESGLYGSTSNVVETAKDWLKN